MARVSNVADFEERKSEPSVFYITRWMLWFYLFVSFQRGFFLFFLILSFLFFIHCTFFSNFLPFFLLTHISSREQGFSLLFSCCLLWQALFAFYVILCKILKFLAIKVKHVKP